MQTAVESHFTGKGFFQIPCHHRHIVLRLFHYILEPWPRHIYDERNGLAASSDFLRQ
jgi:hypothetical protein